MHRLPRRLPLRLSVILLAFVLLPLAARAEGLQSLANAAGL